MSSNENTVQDGADSGVATDPAAKPVRRTFTASYRDRVVAEYQAAPHGQKNAVLRREGLYQSQVAEWAAARDAEMAGRRYSRVEHRKSPKRKARKDNSSETERLRKENERLARELATSQEVVSIMGKLQGLLEQISGSTDTHGKSTTR